MAEKLKAFETEEDRQEALKLIFNDLMDAEVNYSTYQHLIEMTKTFPNAYSATAEFWNVLLSSLSTHSVLALCRLYDKDPQTSGLPGFLRKVELATKGSDHELANELSLVSPSDPHINRLIRWRGHVLAHTNYDRAAGIKKPDAESLLLHSDISHLLDRGMEIYSRHAGGDISRYLCEHMTPKRAAEKVFSTVQAERAKWEQEVREHLSEHGVDFDKIFGVDPRTKDWEEEGKRLEALKKDS